MTHDDAPLTNEGNGLPSVALLPAENRNGEWSNDPSSMQPAGTGLSNDPMVYLHAFRRHWLLSTGLGLLVAAFVAPAVWFGVGARYTADSFLRVSSQEPGLLTSAGPVRIDRDQFDIYKSTQQQLVTSRFVLLAALRKSDVAKLPVIQEEQQGGDPVGWLQARVGVGFPGKAEIMSVSMTRRDPQEATTLVRAVVDAYLKEVVNAERDLKRQRINELDQAFNDKEAESRKKRSDLRNLADRLGTSFTETLTAQQKSTVEELSIYRNEMAKIRFDRRRYEGELAAQTALLESVKQSDISPAELDEYVQRDPVARQLFSQLGMLSIDKAYTEGAVAPGTKSRYADRFQQDLVTLQDQFDARQEELKQVVRQKKSSAIEMEIVKLMSSVTVLGEQEQAAQSEVDRLRKEADKFGSSSVDIEMLRSDIKNLDNMLAGISSEREKLRVESRAASRVTLIQPVEIPEVASNGMQRIALTLFAILTAMCCPAVVVTLWDTLAHRINTAEDVSKGLQLPVLGSVPLIPSRIIRRLGSPGKRYQMWHLRLTESVDGIAARVLHKAEREQCRVVMVSSATSGEGKTTLATQLALSLARTGRRTVLVDFDLRRPSFDAVFGLPLEPGVCEFLRDQTPVSTLIHEIPANDLSVVTAGRWDRLALAALSNGAAAAMFKTLREEYDFVVVDTSPILPVADARFVSQHVDSVVLSVFRDISESPKIQAAYEILTAFGVQNVEAVMTGSGDNGSGAHLGYEATISA